MKKEFLWVEKYRPLNIDDCILPKSLIRTFREFVNNNEIPNLLLCGTAGVGKTTIAKIIGKIYLNLGFLKNNNFITARRSDLIAKYLGQTAESGK